MIHFPKVHIAESVVNRILDVRDQLSSPDSDAPALGAAVPHAPAAVPDASFQSESVEQAMSLTQPGIVPELGGPGSDSAAVFGSVMQGGSALDGLIKARTE